jgi:serine protease inhibitor ecotin
MVGCWQHGLRHGGYNIAHKWWKATTVYRDGAAAAVVVLSLIICPQIKETATFHTNLFDGQVMHVFKTIPVVVTLPRNCSLHRRQDSS